MDKVFSTRLDESVIDELERATRRLRITKKRFLEQAIRQEAQRLAASAETDVWAETAGAWKRAERAETSVRRSRRAFQETFERHHPRRKG